MQAANAIEDVVCAVTSSDAVFKLFNVESDAAVVVLKKFDDLRSVKKKILMMIFSLYAKILRLIMMMSKEKL